MKKRRLYIVELEQGHPNTELNKKIEFIQNFQAAILLTLLKDKQITKCQFDRCIEELKGIMIPHIGRIKKDEV